MKKMNNAHEARKNKVLDTLIRYSNYGYMTRRKFIQMIYDNGGFCEVAAVPSVRYDRRKFNRMDYREQKEYQKKLDTLKKEYRAFPEGDNTFYVITKTEYDYFSRLKNNAL